MSEEVEARLKAGQTKLKPAEWKSGDRCWIVDVVAPSGGQAQLIEHLKQSVLSKHVVQMLNVQGNAAQGSASA